jgi:hypothetical protein
VHKRYKPAEPRLQLIIAHLHQNRRPAFGVHSSPGTPFSFDFVCRCHNKIHMFEARHVLWAPGWHPGIDRDTAGAPGFLLWKPGRPPASQEKVHIEDNIAPFTLPVLLLPGAESGGRKVLRLVLGLACVHISWVPSRFVSVPLGCHYLTLGDLFLVFFSLQGRKSGFLVFGTLSHISYLAYLHSVSNPVCAFFLGLLQLQCHHLSWLELGYSRRYFSRTGTTGIKTALYTS